MKAPSIVPDRRSCLTDLTVDQPPLPVSSSQAPMPLENILDSLDDGIIVLDRQGVILKANPSFCRLFTTSAEGMRAAEVVPGDTFREMLESEKPEVKVLNAVVDLLDDLAYEVQDMQELYDELSAVVDEIDEDLADVESELYDDDDDDWDD